MANLPHLGYNQKGLELPLQAELMKAEASRITQLITHGVTAALMGILLTTAPDSGVVFTASDKLPGWPGTYGIFFTLAGLNLLCRVLWKKKTRNIWWPLLLVALCYLLFGSLFLINFGIWVATGLEGPTPLTYPIAIYFGYFALLLLHIEASKPATKERKNGGSTVG